MLVTTPTGRDILVAGQKSGVVYAVDPDAKGKLLWQARVGKGGTNGGVEWGTAKRWTQCLCGGVRLGADCRRHA